MIIDFHTHCFPDSIAKNALVKLSEVADFLPFYTDGTVGALRASMRTSGIGISVIQHIATKPAQTPGINRWAADINGDGIISFGTIHPDYSAWKDEIKFLTDSRIKGIKFHPDYQDFVVDEKRLYPIYEAVFDAGLIILFHTGLDLGYPPPYKCMPDKLCTVVRDFPGAKIIAAHMGAYDYWDEVEEFLLGGDLYFDTAYCLMNMSPERLVSMIRTHGVQKVLFGSDSPWADQKEEVGKIYKLELSEREKDDILGGNAARLLEL